VRLPDRAPINLSDSVTVTLVGRVTPDLGLVTVQQAGQAGGLMGVGGRSHSMEHFRVAIDADVGFMPKNHWLLRRRGAEPHVLI